MTAPERRPARWATEPFVMGSRAQFARLREWLVRVHFTDAELCAKANVGTIAHFRSLEAGRTIFGKPIDAQSLLVLLFIDGSQIPWTEVRSVLSPEELSTLTDLGLLQPAVSDASKCVGTVALFPDEDVYVVSDRLSRAETIGEGTPSDLVYSPLSQETRQFVSFMPRVPCEDYLEMCAGTGIAALLAAKHFARRASSADITERSTRFAQFNGALNGLDNFTAIQGDLYAPFVGQTFDMITAHPPYVPAESTEMVFRDGGADGEQITRGVVAGLSEHLRPGGLFFLDCVLTDRTAEPIEQRVRRMLGPAEDEFDVVVFRTGVVDVRVYQAGHLASGRMSPEAYLRQTAFFKRARIEQLVDVSILIQRRIGSRSVVTKSKAIGGGTRAEDMVWLVQYLSGTVEWGVEETRRLLDCRPRALPETELRVRSALKDGTWTVTKTMIGTSAPFAAESPCPPWFPTLLGRCDGQTTAREHLARLRADGSVPDAMSDDDFAELLRELADVPFIELDAFPLPQGPRVKPPGLA